jgi:hypothetical protein
MPNTSFSRGRKASPHPFILWFRDFNSPAALTYLRSSSGLRAHSGQYLLSSLRSSIIVIINKLHLKQNILLHKRPLPFILRALNVRSINIIWGVSKVLKHLLATTDASWTSRGVVRCSIDQPSRSSRTRFVHLSVPCTSANSGYSSYSPDSSRLSKETTHDRLAWSTDPWERYSPLWYLVSSRRKRKNSSVFSPTCAAVLR